MSRLVSFARVCIRLIIVSFGTHPHSAAGFQTGAHDRPAPVRKNFRSFLLMVTGAAATHPCPPQFGKDTNQYQTKPTLT